MCRRSSAACGPSSRARDVGRAGARLADRLAGGEARRSSRCAPRARWGSCPWPRCQSRRRRRLHLRAGDDVVAAVGPAHPRLVAAVVVVAEQDQRRRLAHRGARGGRPRGRRPRQIRTNPLCSSSSATVVGSVWPGWIRVSGGSVSSVSMIEDLEVGVGGVAGRADAADRALEQRVAGEHVGPVDQQRQHPGGVARGVERLDRQRAGARSARPGSIVPVAPGTSSRSSGWISTGVPG